MAFALSKVFFTEVKGLVGLCEQRKWAAMKTTASETGSLHMWLEEVWRFPRCHLETHVWLIPADLVKTHLAPILFISTGVAGVVASKGKSLLEVWCMLLRQALKNCQNNPLD